MAYPDIKLGSSFDAKGFKQAETAMGKLTKNVKNLAGAFGIAFGTAAVVNFSKAAVKAFQEDEAAALRLSNAVENLGVGFANADIAQFISDLERSAAIADDILRPAFQGLLTTTGSLTQSQKLLNDAIIISRASGIDLATVSEDLAKGYVGITKGLVKYNTGLTKAEINSKSFNEILGTLLKQSAGAADDYLGTTAYSMEVLSIATGNASEIIGGGLIDAFAAVGGGSEASDAAYVIEQIATAVANVTRATGAAVGVIPTLIKNLKNLPKDIFSGFVGKQTGITPKVKTETPSALELSKEERAKRLAKLEADAAARAKTLAALQKKQAASQLAAQKAQELAWKKSLLIEKARAALTKAAATFDLKKISIAAALKATYDQDTRLRLLAMQAIENDNGEAALKYIEQLARLTGQQQSDKLAGLKGIGEVELAAINKLLIAELDRIDATKMSEADKAAARQEAYKKYNAAIIESGGLADKNFYSEELQIQLLEIARLASIHKVQAAQATLDILNYTSQTEIIDRVAAAQKLADDAKMQALRDYLALLGTTAGIIGALPGGGGGGKAPVIPPTIFPPGFGGGGQPIAPGYGGIFDYVPPTGSTGSGSSDNSVTIIVEGNILNGDEFGDIVNNAILDNIRRGFSQNPAGAIPIP
jgi:hypothetical protein